MDCRIKDRLFIARKIRNIASLFVSWGNESKHNCPRNLDTSATNLNIRSYQNKFRPNQIELQDQILEICLFHISSSNGKARILSDDILNVSGF